MAYGTTEESANRKGAALAVKLGADKWARRVWENLDWCYCARLKENINISVFCHEYPDPNAETSYTCHFNSAAQFIGEGFTPGEALEDAIKKAQDAMNAIVEDIMLVQRK